MTTTSSNTTHPPNGRNETAVARADLADLPLEILLSIIAKLDTADVFRSRYVCTKWHRAFTSPFVLRVVLVERYSRAREVQNLLAAGFPSQTQAWKRTFDKVFARYCALTAGICYSEKRIKTSASSGAFRSHFVTGKQFHVSHWRREFNLPTEDGSVHWRDDNRIPSDPFEPFWTCDEGSLVYFDGEQGKYVVLDLELDVITAVPFDISNCIVRRLRLRSGLLVFEWAQKEAYHKLNPTEDVHRHFVTAFDIKPTGFIGGNGPTRTITLRGEWKLHFLGFPINSQDLWISAHTQDHYAVYIWQRNRSAWGEDEPLESLLVWDISQASDYRPSKDPSGAVRPGTGPRVVKSLSYRQLDHLGIRQRDIPIMRGLGFDDSVLRVIEARYFGEIGDHAGRHTLDMDLGLNWIRVTDIPSQGFGPPNVTTANGIWLGRPSEHGISDLQRASTFNLDKLVFDTAFPGQACEDSAANVRFIVRHCDKRSAEICIVGESWSSSMKLVDLNPKDNYYNIHGDEKRLITQFQNELRIQYFDSGVRKEGPRLSKHDPKTSIVGLGQWSSRLQQHLKTTKA